MGCITLGISGRSRHAAAALAVDGLVTAAAQEGSLLRGIMPDRVATPGFPSAAVAACLQAAGLTAADVTTVAVVSDAEISSAFATARRVEVPETRAHASQVAALACPEAGGPSVIVVLDAGLPWGAVFSHDDEGLKQIQGIHGLDQITRAAATVARALGRDGEDPYIALEQIAAAGGCDGSGAFADALTWDAGSCRLRVDEAALHGALEAARARCPAPLTDPASLNVHVQRMRSCLATTFHARLAEMIGELSEQFRDRMQARRVGFGGSLFACERLNSRLHGRLGAAIDFAPVPERAGLAIGASLSACARPRGAAPLLTLALGPAFSDMDIKAALENCRLDYVYEPDWNRLLARVSSMLAQGKQVAWFQGAADFGPRSLGSRAVLTDPSTPYARDNVNVFLKRRAADTPLPVSMLDWAADECLERAVQSPFMMLYAPVRHGARDRLRAAIDRRGQVLTHTVSRPQAPELYDLLQVHQQRTGVPALINVALDGVGEPTASSPLDAIRLAFSSATDALVMKRFLVMKDYWLLRSTTPA